MEGCTRLQVVTEGYIRLQRVSTAHPYPPTGSNSRHSINTGLEHQVYSTISDSIHLQLQCQNLSSSNLALECNIVGLS